MFNLAFFGLRASPSTRRPIPRFLYLVPRASRGARPAHVRGTGAQGLHPADGRGGDGQDDAPAHPAQAPGRQDGGRHSSSTTTLPFEGFSSTCSRTSASPSRGESQVQRLFALNNFLTERGAPAQHRAHPRRGAKSDPRRSSRSAFSRTSRPRRRSCSRSSLSVSRSSWPSSICPSSGSSSSASPSAATSSPLTPRRRATTSAPGSGSPGRATSGSSPRRRVARSPAHRGHPAPRQHRSATTACSSAMRTRSGGSTARSSRRPSLFRAGRAAAAEAAAFAPRPGAGAVPLGPARAGALLLGGAAALTTAHRDELGRVLALSTATLSGLAHAASSFLTR